ncbi:adenine methyltransferase [Spirochaetia bacterium]|nr:adenine methyltransferase [Spirochaetia bacterium]
MLPPELQQLITNFSGHYESYKRPDYNETALRRDFLDKFIKILGWDVDNEANLHEAFREVIHEDRLKIKEQSKAPDYCIQMGSAKAFYIEAKKPSVNLRDDPSPALQVRRYGWTAGMPVCLLSDFDEFVVYDTSVKPKNTDSAAVARIFYCNYKDLDVHNPKNAGTETNWEYIYSLFSKEAVWKGSLIKLKTFNKKKGTQEVDEVFLQEIEAWREALAANITNRNAAIQERELNYVIQKTIDRIIFLRICEDRGIEEEGKLKAAAAGKGEPVGSVYKQLLKLFLDADDRYNSGLFHFHTEKATDDEPDTLSEKITIDDKVLKDIIKNLYYPDGPYEFAVLPADILGSIYERFLGKVIRLTPGHRAKVEDKPEVKKAGGVYYTPQYIVSYIVENTVGPQLADKTPASLKNFRILDPACGSGSFLIVAYQYLLDWYLGQYTQKPDQYKKQLTKIGSGGTGGPVSPADYKLTIAERKRILTDHMYGVDIDSQAVEVARLSLLLKALEGLNSQEIQKELFNERVLPNLSGNVKCGNSLIGNDFYAQDVLGFTEEEQLKINAFDWDKEYPEVFKDGGFDVVVGNPPYFNIQTLGAGAKEVKYIQDKYDRIWQDKSDILFYFIYKGLQISKGSLGFIVSNAFLFSDKAQKLRNHIIQDGRLSRIVNFEQYMVFEDASITSGIFIFEKGKQQTKAVVVKEKEHSPGEIMEIINDNRNYFEVNFTQNDVFALVNEKIKILNDRIDKDTTPLQDLFIIGKGMETAADDIFLFNDLPKQFPAKFIKRRISGKNIVRYYIDDNLEYVLYFEDIENFSELPASIQDHLKNNKKRLSERADKKRRSTAPWWNYTFAMHKEYYHLPKLYCSRRAFHNTFGYDEGFDYLGFSNMTVIFGTNGDISLKYIMGLLNSSLLNFRYKSIGKQTGGGSFEYFPNGVGKLPIFVPDMKKAAEKEKHDNLVALVDQMLALKKREQAETVPQTKTMIGRQIVALDTQIDKAVYKLYGLTTEEIEVVEGEE